MAAGPSTRVVSITIGYVVLLVALLVIRMGRPTLRPASAPAETSGVASQSEVSRVETSARFEKPAVVASSKGAPSTHDAVAPDPAAPATAPEGRVPIGRFSVSGPAMAIAPEAAIVLPSAPETAAITGDVRTVPDIDRTNIPTVPAPAMPEAPPVVPASVGEPVEGMAALPIAAASVRDISPGDRFYQKEWSALAEVLGHYEQAFDRLDANGAAAIWPSVDARALSRAFARLRRQDIDFGNCAFLVSASDAAARCAGVLRYAQRVGDSALKTEQHVWTIEFARAGESWQIVRISAE